MSERYLSEVMFSSDLTIQDNGILATLAMLYDQIILPHCSVLSRNVYVQFEAEYPKQFVLFEIADPDFRLKFPKQFSLTVDAIKRDAAKIDQWESDHDILYRHNVIKRLEAPKAGLFQNVRREINARSDGASKILLDCLKESEFASEVGQASTTVNRDYWTFPKDLLLHVVRPDLEQAPTFQLPPKSVDSDFAKFLLARTLVKIYLPKIDVVAPEVILDIRNKTADFRTSFGYHLQAIAADLVDDIMNEMPLANLERKAQMLVATKIMPDVNELKNQLHSERANFGRSVLDSFGKMLSIEASPFTPKFYGELLEALIPGAQLISRPERRTNRYHMFQVVRVFESSLAGV